MDLALCLLCIAVCIRTVSVRSGVIAEFSFRDIAKPIAQLQERKVLLHPSYSLKSNSTRQLEFGGLWVFNGSFWVFYWNEGGSIAMCTGESPRNLSHLCLSIFKLNDVKMLIWACRTSEFNLVLFTEKFDFCMYVIWEAQFCTQHHEIFSNKYSV